MPVARWLLLLVALLTAACAQPQRKAPDLGGYLIAPRSEQRADR